MRPKEIVSLLYTVACRAWSRRYRATRAKGTDDIRFHALHTTIDLRRPTAIAIGYRYAACWTPSHPGTNARCTGEYGAMR